MTDRQTNRQEDHYNPLGKLRVNGINYGEYDAISTRPLGVNITNNLLFSSSNTYTSPEISLFSFTTLKGNLSLIDYILVVNYRLTGG